jgi:adenosylcobalamin-dependent ribonucleoside-triphosphate reductase
LKFSIDQRFILTESFIDKYKTIKPNFGFGGLGEFVFMRTYSRLKESGKNEEWWETVRRVVEGAYSIQKQHIEDYRLGWNQAKAQKSAQEMYDRIFTFKMLASGRALWALGTSLTMDKGLMAALYNCSYISTKNIKENPGIVFSKAMDFLMCGIGVGSDVLGANTISIKEQKQTEHIFTIPDSREGWVTSLELLINSFFGGNKYIFDYSQIRPEGSPIKTFGGTSSGYKPLKELHEKISFIYISSIGKELNERIIADTFNLIGKAVVAGNVRRSAEIIFGKDNSEFLDLKDYLKNPEREMWGWASNNSIYAEIGMNYKNIAERIIKTSEPGVYWLQNAKEFGRIKDDERNNKDFRVSGANPCLEITLEDNELCNLVEIIPSRHKDIEDFKTTIKYAYLFAKTITLTNTHWEDTNRVMLRNRRIGLSLTGLAQFVSENNMNTLKTWMEEGYKTAKNYDKIYSEWFAIPESIKITTVKPSGTLSLLAGVTPGVHYPQSKFYIRRIRLANDSPYICVLKNSGYKIEPAFAQEESTSVVEFPVSLGKNIRTISDVSMMEQMKFAEFCQKYWSDNAVSVTVTFKENEAKDIENALNIFQFSLKGVSFLPLEINSQMYKQMPYEEISEERYFEMSKNILPLDFSSVTSTESIGEKYCSNDVCSI